jgi:hypothetical protein
LEGGEVKTALAPCVDYFYKHNTKGILWKTNLEILSMDNTFAKYI